MALAHVLWADKTLESSQVEFIKESVRVVLETLSPLELETLHWQELALASSKASVGRVSASPPMGLDDMTLGTIVPTLGTSRLNSVGTHQFSNNLKRVLPAFAKKIQELAARREYQKFQGQLEHVYEDACKIYSALHQSESIDFDFSSK